MLWLTLILVAATATYVYWKRCNNYWRNLGVPQTNPTILFGDTFYFFFKIRPLTDFINYIYRKTPAGSRYIGFYQFLKPTLAIIDTDLIKQITIKDFNHFTDHLGLISPDAEPLFGKNLFALKGKEWHDMRITLSPSFTSSKMKFMYSLIKQSADEFAGFFINQNADSIELNMKDTFSRFANDVIASTAFGLKVNSLENPENEFFAMGKAATNLASLWVNVKIFFSAAFPRFCKTFKITVLGRNVSDYFINTIKETIEERKEKNIVRPDVIHLLMEAQKGNVRHEEETNTDIDTGFATVQEGLTDKKLKNRTEITDMDIASQAMIFFFAGFDAISNLMCFTAYELALNPEIQKRLRDEVNETFEECNGNISYEALLKMEYLDMVITESLRKWPNGGATDRVCTKPYTIEPVNSSEKPIHLKKGDLVWFPIYALHHDPNYYPEPEKFDPERFSEENKDSINPYAYMPFGVGPRNCIGSRFALLEAKAIFVSILRNFEIVLSPKMIVPLRIDRKSFNLGAEGGFWLCLKRLKNV